MYRACAPAPIPTRAYRTPTAAVHTPARPPVARRLHLQVIIELLEHNPIFTVGYKSVLHIHTTCEECEVGKEPSACGCLMYANGENEDQWL